MGEYLARLASRYDISIGQFIHALLMSRENQKADCGNLSIECRKKTKTQNTFLIRHGFDIVAQFQVATEFLYELDNSALSFKHFPYRTNTPKKSETPQFYNIRDLRAGMNRVNLKAKVLEVTAPRQVNTRYSTVATLAKALISDETGKIQLCLWNEQAETVSVGDTIELRNARASKFNEQIQLSLGSNGKLNNENSLQMTIHLQRELAAE